MNKSAIQKFAIQARTDLLTQVKQQAYNYGIDENGFGDENATTINEVVLPNEKVSQRKALIGKIKQDGYEKVMDTVAYTWFNRFIALRYMEVNDFLPSRVRVFSNDKGEFKPEIITRALELEIDGLNRNKVIELKSDPTKEEDLYRYLLITQCNALNNELPEMFEKMGSYTELLLPARILSDESVIAHLVNDIEEKDFEEAVEIIGWLFQFYNTEPKADVYAGLKKNVKVTKENIPSATQIFTPDWIVRYMVENSIGRLWVESHENKELTSKWKYYLEEAEQEESVQVELNKIREEYKNIKLEDIKIIDPCMGSGHILVYAFEVLIDIYESQGYSSRESASLILENNLYGLDIDERAYQLAYFALMMKGRSYDRRFLTRGIKPQVYCPKNYNDGLEYGSLIDVKELEEKPLVTEQINLLEESYEDKLNKWNFRRLLNQKYDVVITNPPYLGSNNISAKLSDYIKKNYPDSKSDLFATFIERGNELVKVNGFNCMVTMQSWMFLSSYEKMREKIVNNKIITNLMHMDNMVMGIAFGTAVSIIRNTRLDKFKGTYNYVTLKDIGDDDIPLEFPVEDNRFAQINQENFARIPGSPIAYWVSEKMLEIFEKNKNIGRIAPAKQGLATANNDIFLRLWFETNFNLIYFNCESLESSKKSRLKWFPYNKGGKFRRWYGNREYIVNWENDGHEIRNFKDENGKTRSRAQNTQYYFKPAITWSDITSSSFSGRFCEKGFMFDVKGSSGFPSEEIIYYILGFLNSKISQEIIKILNPTNTTQVGDMSRIPVAICENNKKNIDILVEESIRISKTDWDAFETSWDFVKHPLSNGKNITGTFENWQTECNNRFNQLKANEEELNRIFIDIYGLREELTLEIEDKDVTVRLADLERDIKSFISYAVGCMFGRYSLDTDGLAYAGGNFDSSKYTSFMPDKDNIIPICDDEYFGDDIVNRFVEFVKVVYGADTLEENLDFIADALNKKGATSREIIRTYFLNDFYKDHVKTYQKRPIYWLFDSGKKNGFKALIYMHRYQKDLLAKVRTDYVHEQQERYNTQLANIESELIGASQVEKAKLNKLQTKFKDQALEIRQYEEKIKHLADQQIEIDLDDGVVKNYALFEDVLAKIK